MTHTSWEVKEVGENATGKYFQLNIRTKGDLVAPVVVKHSTRHDTMVCLTHLTADECAHSQFVRRYVEAHQAVPQSV